MKPIAVLLLVLVAVGALIFGLFTLGGGKHADPTTAVKPDPAALAKPSPKPSEIEKPQETSGRQEDVAKVEADRTPVGDFVYANDLRLLAFAGHPNPIPAVEPTL